MISIPDVLARQRRKSIDTLHTLAGSGVVHDNVIRAGDTDSLPSLQMRRWQRVGRVMGVAIALKILTAAKRTASDPEITDSSKNVVGGKDVEQPVDMMPTLSPPALNVGSGATGVRRFSHGQVIGRSGSYPRFPDIPMLKVDAAEEEPSPVLS